MAEWYYTTNNQQMGPISWDELRQLASTGLLLPNDMVWKEGMVDWVKANNKGGLFAEEAAPRREARYADDRPRPRSRASQDDDDDFDDRPRRRRRPAASGMPLGAKVAIIGGSIAVGLLILVVVIVLLVRGGNSAVVGPNHFNFTLFQGQERTFFVRFNAGQNVRATVTSQAAFNTDVDLFIMRNNGNMVASDTRVSKDCLVNFIAPATDTYRVRVVNLGPGQAICDLNIQ